MKGLLNFALSSRIAFVIFLEIAIGLGVIILCLLFFADFTKDTLWDQDLVRLDHDVSIFIYSLRSPILTEIMTFISFLGADFIIGISAIILIFLTWKKHKRESILFSIMLISGALLNLLLKIIFQRSRPTFDPLELLSSYSFPSAHAMNSFIFYATIAYFSFHFTGKIKSTLIVSIFASMTIALIGFSRVYLGVHYPSDILAGYVAGLFYFILILVVERATTYVKLYKNFLES